MLEKESLEVVGACLPFYQNAEASIAAAHWGIHVLSEKPAATDLSDLARLEREVRQSGIQYSMMLDMCTLLSSRRPARPSSRERSASLS